MRALAAAAALFLVLSATGRSAPPRPSSGVVLDAKSGRVVATVRANQPIRTAIDDGRGRWFLGGGFIRVNGVLRKRLAHIGPDGVQNASGLAALQPDDGRPAQGWHAIVDTSNIEGGGVRAMAHLNGKLYIAGRFSKVNGLPKPGVAALDARTGRVFRDWLPRRRPRYCIACSDVTSLAAGRGLVFAGVPGAVLALDPRSGATRWRARVGGFEVDGLALAGKRLYVVGDFGLRTLSAATVRRLRAWSPPSYETGVTAAPSAQRVLIGLQPN